MSFPINLTSSLSRGLSLDPAALPTTMVEALARAARENPTRGITLLGEDERDPIETRTFGDLADRVWGLAGRLQATGISAGERVLVVLPTGIGFVETFLALQLIGAVPVPAYPPPALQQAEVALKRLRHIVANAQIRVCLTDRTLNPLMKALAGIGQTSVSQVLTIDQLPAAAAPTPAQGEVAFYQYTSGSTGRPKGVVVTHKALMANILACGQAVQVSPDDVMVSWLPLYHDMGLVGGLLWPIFWQIPLVLMSPMAFLRQPERWLHAISDYRGTLSMAPNFAYARCLKRIPVALREGLDLSSWRLALNGAEPVSAPTVAAFAEAFAPHGLRENVMFPCYGLAESVVGVTFSTPGEPLKIEHLSRHALGEGRVERSNEANALEICAVGSPIPGHSVTIVDEDGRAVPDRVVGEITVQGPSLMAGYHDNKRSSAAALRGGRLNTGDLGFMDQGQLYVTGRQKDLIIVRGKNVHAEDVETVAEQIEGVRKGRVVAFGCYDEARAVDRVVLVVEGVGDDEETRSAISGQIKSKVCEVMGLTVSDVVFVSNGSIPKTYSGKRQRQLTKKRHLAGTLGERPRFAYGRILARAAVGFVVCLGASMFGSAS
ncbi:MAG: fatty acyl-AMP ligase [Planctomycetes bacterium]|nr:fatty acyl-AMP ligase [Planctomycetota bacterium]